MSYPHNALGDNAREKDLYPLLMSLGESSVEQVNYRSESLQKSIATLLISSILMLIGSVVVWFIVISLYPDHVEFQRICFIGIVLTDLISILCCLIGCYRYKYIILQPPANLADYVVEHKSEFESVSEVGQFYCRCLNDYHASIQNRNNILSMCIKISALSLIICVCFVVGLVVGSLR